MDEDFKSTLAWANEQLDELTTYTQTEAFRKLTAEDQDLIVQQASALNAYTDVLTIRAAKVKK
jgi:hypothetical protein